MMQALKKLASTVHGYKRIATIVTAILVSLSNRFGLNLDPALINDITAIILAAGLGAHVSIGRKGKVAAASTVLFLLGCTPVVTEAKHSAWLELTVGAPHDVKSFADGELKCHQHGPMELELRGRPGDCIQVGADGKFQPCK